MNKKTAVGWYDQHPEARTGTAQITKRKIMQDSKEKNFQEVERLWNEFAKIPVDSNDQIEKDFHIWEAGTDKFEIWIWFDENTPNGVAKFM